MSLSVKMAADLVFLILMLNVLSLSLSQNPCVTTMKIPNINKRDRLYEVPAGDSLISDRFLKEGWYGTGDNRSFLDTAPGLGRCGTLYPIWRREKIGIRSTMCVQNTEDVCFNAFNITTMPCGMNEIYNLKRSSVRHSAYCFGWPDGDRLPVFAETPIVGTEVVHKSNHTSELEFHCKFSNHSDDVFYHTNWLINGNITISTDPMKWENGDVIQKQALTEEMLRTPAGITTLGFEVRCSARASYAVDKQSSRPMWSNTLFIGIKVSNTTLVLKEGQSTDISLQLTAPFACGHVGHNICVLDIEAYNIDKMPKALISSVCGQTIKQSQWNTSARINVTGKISKNYGFSSQVIKLKLKTGEFFSNRLWSYYNIGLITVQITKDTSKIEGKSCYAINDPHMKTFDGRRYEHQFEGNFTMYKHNTLPVEVQLQTASCNNGRNAWCNCGVAVRAGKTVFEFNRCPGYTKHWTAEYTLCEDGGDVLQVKRKGKNYEVYLPTGGKVKVFLYRNFLNVYIYPSVQDVENSVGLCGKLSDVCSDDFVMRDGSYSTDTTADGDCNVGYRNWENLLTQFSNSWSVDASENLFNNDAHRLLSAWPKTNTFCSCPDEKVGAGEKLVGRVVCTATEASEFPTELPGFTDVPPSKCYIRHRRKRRSAPDNGNVDKRLRRQAPGSWTNGWTEEAAQSHCEQLFQDSKSVQVCRNVTGVETTGSIDNCVMDIWLTGTTIFGSFSIDTVRSKCLHEIRVNPVLREKGSKTNQSVYDVVVAQVCSNDCSGQGTCMKGECICETHYGGDDCSVDLRLPPELVEVENDGHCDTSRDTCHVISIYGETFLDNGVSCLVEEIKVGTDGVENTGNHTVPASTQSINHVQCSISTNMDATGSDDTEFVQAYRIFIANTGTVYSESLGIMVYDGTCVKGHINGTDFKWSVEGPFCVYKGTCIAHLDIQPGNTCQVCDVTGNIRAWKRSSDASCVEQTKDFPVVSVVAGVAGVIVLTLIVAIFIVCVKKRKWSIYKVN